MKTSQAVALAIASLLVATGCGAESIDVGPDAPFAGGGEAPAPPGPAYPKGPYGFGIGSIVPEMRFIGYAKSPEHDRHNEVTSPTVEIALSDFYNPTGDGLYPSSSTHGAGSKPTVLLVDVEQVWCPPSNNAAIELPARYQGDAAIGIEFLEALEDGPSPGVPATPDDLDQWELRYRLPFPVVVDPGLTLDTINLEGAWPLFIEIDTTTMQIVDERAGYPDQAFWFTLAQDAATR